MYYHQHFSLTKFLLLGALRSNLVERGELKKNYQHVIVLLLIINIPLFPILRWVLKRFLKGTHFSGICVGNVDSNASKAKHWKVELVFIPVAENKMVFATVMTVAEFLTKCCQSGSSFIFLSLGGILLVFLYVHLSFTPNEELKRGGGADPQQWLPREGQWM